ncbi:exonuclease 3'-5' domain-containing 2 [Aphomia sociella]
MEIDTMLKLCITFSTFLVGCATAVYLILKYNRRLRNAADALNYLTIKTVSTAADCEVVVKELLRRCQAHRAVGFDCEWVTENGKKRPVALLQLSTLDGYCGLFRLNQLQTIPNSLKMLLETDMIYKVGVAPVDDAKYLSEDYSINFKSSLDIRHIAVLCGHNPGGLGSLTKSLLHIVLDKSWRIRCSDWEADTLSEKQVNYAAADAHVAIKIFVKLINKLNSHSIWKVLYGNKDTWSNLDELCLQYADYNFKTIQGTKIKDVVTKNCKKNKPSKTYPHATRSKPLYHNCFLQAPDGELLCTCDNKKALWYVEKQLADVVNEEPLTVRLRFEPAGRSVGLVGLYYQLTKENKCVVCGSANSYIRKNVVPREYRKYFPEIMKEHSSHDVVLLCARCHQRSNIYDQHVRERLAARCGAPLASRDCGRYTEDMSGKKIRSAARALLNHKQNHTLPEARRKELESVLLQYYTDRSVISTELLKEAAELQVLFENTDYEAHGLKVVEYFLEQEGGLLRLEEIWRVHFLSSMKPKFMPQLWSIKHNEERLRVKYSEGRLSEKDIKSIGASRWL